MIHGFPDSWYLWRHHIEVLSKDYQVVAVDKRGYNRSDKPKSVNSYTYDFLVGDIAAVIRDAGHESATVVGHDWGGFVAWMFAMQQPEMTDQLVIFNLPHPRGVQRELVFNRRQKQNSAYARRFQAEGAHLQLSAEQLAGLERTQDAPVVKVQPPVLQFHGLNDPTLLQGILNDTWDWVARDLTLVTIPDASNWAITEKADFTIGMMQAWLALQAAER